MEPMDMIELREQMERVLGEEELERVLAMDRREFEAYLEQVRRNGVDVFRNVQ